MSDAMNQQTKADKTPDEVADEERLLGVVLEVAARPAPVVAEGESYDQRLLKLRDEMVEERLPEDRASLLEQMDRLARLAAQRATFSETPLDTESPYFAHMRLVGDDGERKDILLGKTTWVKDGVRIVDWRNAPISRVFYLSEEGEDFELPIAGRLMAGEVAIRRRLTIRDGQLKRVTSPRGTWVHHKGQWVDVSGSNPTLQGGSGRSARPDTLKPVLEAGAARLLRPERVDKHLPEIASLLDKDQFELITRPDSGVVAIQGSAGSGKTTVALHRVAYLAYHAPRRFGGQKSLVLVFSPALRAYISQVLPALGVSGVNVSTYDEWVSKMRRKVYRNRLPDKYCEETPSAVVRFKLHSAMLAMLVEGAAMNPELDSKELWDELFTSRQWVEQIRLHAPGAFSESDITEIYRWGADQHFIRFEGHGHREHEEPTLDHEDDTILVYLHQILHGRISEKNGSPIRYGHLVVDEAQDLSPIELKVLTGTVEKGGAITLAGDTAQRLEADNDFQDWAHVLGTLGLDHVALSPLKISYRSTASIMAVAHHVLGPLAPEEEAHAPRDGMIPQVLRFGARGEAMTFLADALRDLQAREPTASIGVLGGRQWQVDHAFAALERTDVSPLHRVSDFDFSFEPGVELATVRQSKGLEFDYVILLDVDVDTYPLLDSARHLLHVGLTRAAHQVWCVTVNTPSPLLPDWMPVVRF